MWFGKKGWPLDGTRRNGKEDKNTRGNGKRERGRGDMGRESGTKMQGQMRSHEIIYFLLQNYKTTFYVAALTGWREICNFFSTIFFFFFFGIFSVELRLYL